MKDVFPHDRPREKLERIGASGLGDNELLALVIGSGTRAGDALAVANRLLAASRGLTGLTRLGPAELRRVAGIGPARAAQVLAAIELGRRSLVRGSALRPQLKHPREVALHLLPEYGARPTEHFGVVLLDTKCRAIGVRVVSAGSLDATVVHPREVFREAAIAHAAFVVLFHNHPSGDPKPSEDDLLITARMIDAGEIMGIEVVDHVILADERYYSLREAGQIRAGPFDRLK